MTEIKHESEAKALFKGSVRAISDSVRNEIESYADNLRSIVNIKAKSARNKKMISFLDRCFSHGLLTSFIFTFRGVQQKNRKIWLHLALAQYTALDLRTVHRYPVSIQVLDLWQSREIKGIDSMFYVSKHALERIMLRNQETEIEEICNDLTPFANSLAKALISHSSEKLRGEFVMVGAGGVATTIPYLDEENGRSVPLITTYIPLDKLSKSKFAHLKVLFDVCLVNTSTVFFLENELYENTEYPLVVCHCFGKNTGLVGDESYPVLLDTSTIQSL